MTTLTFDTLKFANRLKAAGVPEKQAEAEAEALAYVMQDAFSTADLSTKSDLAIVKADLEVKIAETKSDLIRWVVGVGMLQTALIAAMLLKLIPS